MQAKRILDERFEGWVGELRDWLRIASVSTRAESAPQVRQAADWAVEHLRGLGFSVRLHETAGHPAVLAQREAGPELPTLLIYGHYDVQPAEPLALWQSLPFEPVVREGRVWARGVSDDKGLVLMAMKAVEAWLAAEGRLPINVKFILEGEEETGSANLPPLLLAEREALACDVMLVIDTEMAGPGRPGICYGLRGLAAFEVEVETCAGDLHSGSWGGLVDNPIMVLAHMLASTRNADGRVLIRGFYDDVRPVDEHERARMAAVEFGPEHVQAQAGAHQVWGVAEHELLARRWSQPTFEPNGIVGGYTEAGIKTVLPASATLKFTLRLVPDQEPDRLVGLVQEHFQRLCPPTAKLKVTYHGGSPGVVFDTSAPCFRAAAEALRSAFDGVEPAYIRTGGSIPITSELARVLGAPVVLLGLSETGANIHAPNENMSLDLFRRGIETCMEFFGRLAADSASAG